MNITRRNFVIGGVATLGAITAIPTLTSCTHNTTTKSGLKISNFESDGTASFNTGLQNTYTSNVSTTLCVLRNQKGMEVCITNLGARVVSIMVQDKDGKFRDVCLGFDNISDYANIDKQNNVLGAEVGRTINRIANAKFTYDGIEYNLEKNYKDKHNIHGGKFGWHYQTWTIKEQKDDRVVFSLVSPDGDGGFPGEMEVEVTYTLDNENALWIDVKAMTSKASPLNIANHTYFNLEGDPTKDCYDYQIQILAERFIPSGEDAVPTNVLEEIPVNSDLDFYSKPKTMSKNLDTSTGLYQYSKGYDFSFLLEANTTTNASVYCPKSGIKMDVITDRPILHFYDAHDLDGTMVGKNNIAYKSMSAVCFEAQTIADGVNKDNFLNTILKPGQLFTSSVQYKFSVE